MTCHGVLQNRGVCVTFCPGEARVNFRPLSPHGNGTAARRQLTPGAICGPSAAYRQTRFA